jgi:hypothetical protein
MNRHLLICCVYDISMQCNIIVGIFIYPYTNQRTDYAAETNPDGTTHSVDRVPGFLSSRPNGLTPPCTDIEDVTACLSESWLRAVYPPTLRHVIQVLHNTSVVV